MLDQKVNLLIAAAGLNIGGAEMVIKHLVKAIDRRRFNVIICCIKVCGVIGDELIREGINIVTLKNSAETKVDYFTFIKLLNLIRLNRIDIVHTHTTDALGDAAVCKLFVPRLKLIHTFHYGNYPNLKTRHLLIERVSSKLANKVIAVGEMQKQQLKSTFRFRDGKIRSVWNGVSLGSKRCDDSLRTKFGADNRIIIGTIATLIEQKGLRDLLLVAKKLQGIGKVRFVIVGDGYLRQELAAMSLELGVDDVVEFAGWMINAAEIALPTFDIFFQPSLWEAMSIAILEAMAAGKPIVATRVGETPYIIENEVDGLLVEPMNIEEMAEALSRLINDAELRLRLGEAAARKVARQYTVDGMARTYEQIYMEVLKSNL
jgi:glycosyltransferase involved in cell wall biosynthesis